jgi:hypothetical protein
VTGKWFSPGILVSSTNKTGRHNITEILLQMVLNTITLTLSLKCGVNMRKFLSITITLTLSLKCGVNMRKFLSIIIESIFQKPEDR